MKFPIRSCVLLVLVCLVGQAADVKTLTDVPYLPDAGKSQQLDLYLPNAEQPPQLLIWVHSGAWRRGDKARVQCLDMLNKGYAIASVNYRLSTEAKFPAVIHDLKAAIRFLRGNAATYGYNADKIAVMGPSAGGHLVALLGVTNGHKELEGTLGNHLQTSSDVQAVVNFFGPTNFMTILKQSTPHGLSVREPALKLLLGDRPGNVKTLAELASPVHHVNESAAPTLIFHGDQDPQVPINQSHELHAKYKAAAVACDFVVVHGGDHGKRGFFGKDQVKRIDSFLRSTLRIP